jgi:hypothetical protein
VLIVKAAMVVVVLSLGVVAATSCSQTRPNRQELTGPTVDVPQFAIAIKLSPKAEERLRNLHETVKVISYFDGDALPGRGKYNPPMRDVYLGMSEQAVDDAYVARFEHIKVPKSDWDRLADKDFLVTINTVSARKAAANNLLACADPMSRKVSTMKGKTIEVQCSLIGEPNSVAPDQHSIGAAALSKVGQEASAK